MAKKGLNQNKKLVLKTLNFLIRARNIALFRLNAYQNGAFNDLAGEIKARITVYNLRSRIIWEINKNKHLLSKEEKNQFYYDPNDADYKT